MISKIGLAITFSPTGKALLKETLRLQNLFNAQLVLIHIGEKNKEAEERLFTAIENSGIAKNSYEVIWDKGDPASATQLACLKNLYRKHKNQVRQAVCKLRNQCLGWLRLLKQFFVHRSTS